MNKLINQIFKYSKPTAASPSTDADTARDTTERSIPDRYEIQAHNRYSEIPKFR